MMRDDDQLSGLLADCADLLLAGAGLPACLERFPDQAPQLEPLLATVASVRELRAVPPRSADVALRSRNAFMQQVIAMQPRRAPVSANVPLWQRLLTIFQFSGYGKPQARPVALLVILLTFFLSGIFVSGGVTMASSALPGDMLYGVKTATEDVRLFLTFDSGMRERLRAAFRERRVAEAEAVVAEKRQVEHLRLAGVMQSFDAQQWVVSGLRVTLDASSQVDGAPAAGALVEGRMRAPGDGRLVLIYGVITPPAEPVKAQSLSHIAPPATATDTPRRAAALPPTATPTRTPTATRAPLGLPGLTPVEPADLFITTPTPTASATPTETPSPTRTPPASPTPAPTATLTPAPTLPLPRPLARYRIIGYVTAINGSVWTVDGANIEVTSETGVTGGPVVGSKVECEVQEREFAMLLALNITSLAPPEATPEPFEFQAPIHATGDPWWTIGDFQVKVTGSTTLVDNPAAGDLAFVRALRQNTGELWAESIRAVRYVIVQVDGVIDAYSAGSIVVGGHVVAITEATSVVGAPEVGRLAQVRARQFENGSLVAEVIVVVEPAPTATWTPTDTPIALPPTPTALPATPTDTPTIEATPASTTTGEPTATPTF